MHLTVSRAYKVNPNINFEVFIHKVDGLSDDHKIATQRDIHQRANDDLADASLEKLHLRWVLLPVCTCSQGFDPEFICSIAEIQISGMFSSRAC